MTTSTVFSLHLLLRYAGLKQATAGLLEPWASPVALSGAPPFAFPGFSQSAPWAQSLEHGEGYEERGGEELGEDGLGGLFAEGVWATSVRRKRVTKMRKHKWRKRRKLERQSAARRSK